MVVRRLIPLVILVVLTSVAIAACGGGDGGSDSTSGDPTSPPTTPPAQEPTRTGGGSNGGGNSGGGTAFAVELQDPDYAFSPDTMEFSVGDTISFELTSQSEFHTFTVEDLGIDVSVDAGETVTHTVTFDEAGTYDLICIPHELLGMTGTITVR